MVAGERGCGSAAVRVSGESTGSILRGGRGGYCARVCEGNLHYGS